MKHEIRISVVRRAAVGLAALVTVAPCIAVWADSLAPPSSYSSTCGTEKHLFVMLAPLGAGLDQQPELRRRYPKSGLYLNGDPSTPAWTVDWYAYTVVLASDCVHMIRPGLVASSTEGEGITLFARGVLLRSYRIRELVDAPELFFDLFFGSASHFRWAADHRLEDAELRYTLWTYDGNRIVVDMRSGAVLSRLSVARALLLAAAMLLVAAIWTALRIARSRRQAKAA